MALKRSVLLLIGLSIACSAVQPVPAPPVPPPPPPPPPVPVVIQSVQAAPAPPPNPPVTPPPADHPPPIVAVLPLNVSLAGMDEASHMTLEEDIRSVAGNHLTALGYTVLTGENTLRVLADNGVDATKACEASCALDAARELKAEYFIAGSVAKSEGTYVAFIRLFEQRRGQQLDSVKLEGEKVRDFGSNSRRTPMRYS